MSADAWLGRFEVRVEVFKMEIKETQEFVKGILLIWLRPPSFDIYMVYIYTYSLLKWVYPENQYTWPVPIRVVWMSSLKLLSDLLVVWKSKKQSHTEGFIGVSIRWAFPVDPYSLCPDALTALTWILKTYLIIIEKFKIHISWDN